MRAFFWLEETQKTLAPGRDGTTMRSPGPPAGTPRNLGDREVGQTLCGKIGDKQNLVTNTTEDSIIGSRRPFIWCVVCF